MMVDILKEYIMNNKTWIFSGIGISVLSFFFDIPKYFFPKKETSVTNIINNNLQHPHTKHTTPKRTEERKRLTRILFIDDDTSFKVVKILKKSGWVNTKIIKDVTSVDDKPVQDADICFIDIQGVAKNLFKKDQGLGLVGAIVDRYPHKRVVVYSAQTQGNRFNQLLEKAHARLPKNANPYEFQNLVDNLSKEIYK